MLVKLEFEIDSKHLIKIGALLETLNNIALSKPKPKPVPAPMTTPTGLSRNSTISREKPPKKEKKEAITKTRGRRPWKYNESRVAQFLKENGESSTKVIAKYLNTTNSNAWNVLFDLEKKKIVSSRLAKTENNRRGLKFWALSTPSNPVQKEQTQQTQTRRVVDEVEIPTGDPSNPVQKFKILEV